jgi:hypothetical protein
LEIVFTWPVPSRGFEVEQRIAPTDESPLIVLEPRGGGLGERWQSPLSGRPALFREFAALDETPQAAADFGSRYGWLFPYRLHDVAPLDLPGLPEFYLNVAVVEHPDDGIEYFEQWCREIRRMRRLVAELDEATAKGHRCRPNYKDLRLPGLIAQLVDHGGAPAIELKPDCLISALDLQFYRVVVGLSEIRACDACGTWFECGPGKGRRGKSRFCSDKCRFNFHNARKGMAK